MFQSFTSEKLGQFSIILATLPFSKSPLPLVAFRGYPLISIPYLPWTQLGPIYLQFPLIIRTLIPTFLLSRSGNSFMKNSHSKKEFPL